MYCFTIIRSFFVFKGFILFSEILCCYPFFKIFDSLLFTLSLLCRGNTFLSFIKYIHETGVPLSRSKG